jgi:hypothetical protein
MFMAITALKHVVPRIVQIYICAHPVPWMCAYRHMLAARPCLTLGGQHC